MIYESQVRRSETREGTTDNSEQTALGATLQPIEDALQKGVEFAKANPLIAVASAAAVGAIVVMAAKSASRRDDTTIERMRHDLDRFLSRQRYDGSGISDTLSNLTRSFTAEPETMAVLRKVLERGISRASDTLKSVTTR